MNTMKMKINIYITEERLQNYFNGSKQNTEGNSRRIIIT